MPVFRNLACFGIALSLTVGVVHADNWERFRGPNGTGIAGDKNIPIEFSATENVRWKIKVEGIGHSSPIVWGDHLFLQSANPNGTSRSLYCFDTKTGDQVWKRSVPGTKVKFRFDSSHASATPVTDGNAVYIPFWDGKDIIMTAYDFKGEKLWDRNLGEFVSQHGAGASPILYKDLVIFSMDKNAYRDTTKKTGPVANPSTLYAFNAKTGKTVWEQPREPVRACYSAPFLIEKGGMAPELIVTSTSAITSYEPETGKSNWYWTWQFAKDPLRTIAATTYADNRLFACSGDGSGERLMVGVELKGNGKTTRAEQIWSNPKAKEPPYVTCPIIKGDHVYLVGDLGLIACVEARTGKKLWTEKTTDSKFYASPVMIDDKIYACNDTGDVYVFAADPKGYRELARNRIGGVIRATPAVANGALYIRTEDSLYCIGKK